jgi:hypothetical protein
MERGWGMKVALESVRWREMDAYLELLCGESSWPPPLPEGSAEFRDAMLLESTR